MKPEEFEVYVIPPNFMEGGTLFGGLLKTRNTVEAVILGLAVGVPVLHLPFSLTVRVVILCLTALPLVLLALIGVSGMSLSAFIRLFFCFLHNRRILSRDGTQGGKNGKTLLPSWAQQRKSDCEAEDPPHPKSRSRFSVDLKQRSVTQFKTFLQEEEAVQPLNALADYIPIEKIEHGVIYTRDHRYVKVVEVVPVNFLLRSAREQRSIIYSFISYLKIAPVKVQFKALTKRADINRHLDILFSASNFLVLAILLALLVGWVWCSGGVPIDGREWVIRLLAGHGTGYFYPLGFMALLLAELLPLWPVGRFLIQATSENSAFLMIRSKRRNNMLRSLLCVSAEWIACCCGSLLMAEVIPIFALNYAVPVELVLEATMLRFLDMGFQFLVIFLFLCLNRNPAFGFLVIVLLHLLSLLPIPWLPVGASSLLRLRIEGTGGTSLPVTTTVELVVCNLILLTWIWYYGARYLFGKVEVKR